MEISELVHRQLVTSTLHGPFRNSLERHVGVSHSTFIIIIIAIFKRILLRMKPAHIHQSTKRK